MKNFSRRTFCTSLSAACSSMLLRPVASLGAPAASTGGTGYVHHPDFSRFENNSAEHFTRTRWIDEWLSSTEVVQDTLNVVPISTPMEQVAKIHTPEHITLIDNVEPFGGFSLSLGGAARMAVAHILGAVRDVCSGRLRNAFCSIRPPGHHVMNSGEIGFCCFANVVLAARFARTILGENARILIVDWDYHQGNGTHHFICSDTNTLFFDVFNPTMYTTRCSDFKPVNNGDTVSEEALRINVRMPTGSTNDDFIRAFERYLIPAAERFRPQLVLISCGFDCKKNDSLGRFQVTAHGISKLTRMVMRIADTWADGKLVSLLEGGYKDWPRDSTVPGRVYTYSGLAQCAENHVKTLLTGDVQKETPYFSSTVKTP